MIEIHKYINRPSFHPFILFSPNILYLILYAHICLWFPTHLGLRALQKSNPFRVSLPQKTWKALNGHSDRLGKWGLWAPPGVHHQIQEGAIIALKSAASVYVEKGMPKLVWTLNSFKLPEGYMYFTTNYLLTERLSREVHKNKKWM